MILLWGLLAVYLLGFLITGVGLGIAFSRLHASTDVEGTEEIGLFVLSILWPIVWVAVLVIALALGVGSFFLWITGRYRSPR